MVNNENLLKLNWENVNKFVENIVEQFENEKWYKSKIPGIYAVPRGGLVLGVCLSHALNLPLLASPVDNCIIVDDIADSGKTLQHWDESNKYHIYTMCYKKQSIVKPEYYLIEVFKDEWVIFPWEMGNVD